MSLPAGLTAGNSTSIVTVAWRTASWSRSQPPQRSATTKEEPPSPLTRLPLSMLKDEPRWVKPASAREPEKSIVKLRPCRSSYPNTSSTATLSEVLPMVRSPA